MADEHDRAFPRATVDIKAEYKSAENFIESYMRQVGEGGLFIEQEDPAPMNSEIELSFNLPGDPHVIAVRAKVVWRMTHAVHDIFARGVGVKFVEISDEDRKRIGEFVKKHQ